MTKRIPFIEMKQGVVSFLLCLQNASTRSECLKIIPTLFGVAFEIVHFVLAGRSTS